MAIGSVGATSASLQSNGLNVQDFLKILTTQLSYQDPLKPMDNQQFMAQMAQFTTLQQTQEMNEKLGILLGNQAALQSVGLIGRQVDMNLGGTLLSGAVTALSLAGDSPQITVTTTSGAVIPNISLSQIIAVR